MAHRKNKVTIRVDSEKVQGEGSFVVIKRMTWGDLEPLTQDAGEKQDMRAIAAEFMPRLVVDWNWVDDNDSPLPKPADNPEIIKALPTEELTFLLEAVELLKVTAPKN